MTEDNRDKFIQIADRYGQLLKFYNAEELCVNKLTEIEEYFPKAKESHFSIAMFYRLFIPYLLLPQGIEKVIYLDSDIIVNLDIKELWQIELGNKPLGAITRASQIKDKEFSLSNTSKVIPLVREGFVNPEDYFNSGVMLINLRALRKEEDNILAGMKFISDHPKFPYLDQDILNYCFSTTFLKLPVHFNRVNFFARSENELTIEKMIYHYAALRLDPGLYTNDPYSQLFMNYFIKTPWVDADTKVALTGGIPSRKNYAISVVIPMYNAAEFIGECLDSLLIQTFQDFEIIVVDDCSTDNSVKIVEEYAPKFNGRLKIEKTEKNSGTGGYVSRNMGLMLACGEYIQFLDADDMILGNALETLYKAAILHDAEIVYTSSYYRLNAENDVYLYKDGTSKKMLRVQTDFTVDDFNTNLSRLLFESGEGNFHNCWTKFVRRDFLMKNRIFFSQLPNAADFLWVVNVYCHARRFLRISTPLYFYRRYNIHSISRVTREIQGQCWYWFSSFVDFAKALYELEKKNKVLAENPDYALATLNKHFSWCLNRTEYARKELNSEGLFSILHSEFAKNSDDLATLLPFFFSFIDTEKKVNSEDEKRLNNNSKIINKFSRYFTAKIYVRMDKKLEAENLQLISVSDKEARISKPEWWQKRGVCYMIDSYAGNLEINAKATVSGKIQIRLSGPFVTNPEDKSKHVPYWIDYTNLTVNGQKIFDKLTPVWHDEFYNYMLDVKAGDEIKIQTEWLPHDSNAPVIVESKPEKIENKVEPVVEKFLPYLTSRVDVKLIPQDEGDFQILSVTDDKATVKKARWLPKKEIGYVIQSYAGNMEIITKADANGQIQLDLRSMEVRNPENKRKRIPYWIDYTKLTVNGEILFDNPTSVWYSKPYHYTLEVKAGDEIKIQTEWLPHSGDAPAPSPPPVVIKDVQPIASKFLPYFTSRVDIQLQSQNKSDFQIVSVSDENANVKKATWLPKNRIGYSIQSCEGHLNLVTKTTADGQIQLNLRGLDVRDAKNKSKRVPYWIDYKNLTINGEKIFDNLTPVWHDKPYKYTFDVKAGDEITIQTEWLPHQSEP